MKNPRAAFFLSLAVPGLGQLYLNEKAKGISLFCIAAGIVISLVMSHSLIAVILIGPLYLFSMVPAALDAYQTAAGKPRRFKSDSVLYVIIMLLVVGPFAVPIFWTVFVTVIALGAIVVMASIASVFDKMMQQTPAAMTF